MIERRSHTYGVLGEFDTEHQLCHAARAAREAGWVNIEGYTPFPVEALGQPRGRVNSPGKVSLPYGWLDSRDDDTVPVGAETDESGG